MSEYLIPTSHSEVEFTEKRSRFIGQVWNVDTEEQARQIIASVKQKYYDARHTCWCYIIKAGGIMRYSDDGEPQGTAGQPMLEVFRRNNIENVCCTVTRYFGGILLGAGGLVRAYSGTAKLALDAAGISQVRMWNIIDSECSYSQLERVKLVVAEFGGIIDNIEYSSSILITSLIPQENTEDYILKLTDFSAGTIFSMESGSRFMAAPLIPAK